MKDVPIYWHIGVHKTATTWLQKGLLKDHPEIALVNDPKQPWDCPVVSYIVSTKERRYSTDEATRRLHEQAEKTNNSATKAVVVSAERLSGHPISGHYDRFKIARRISNLGENQNLIVVFRNPVSLIPSIYQQMVREGFGGTYRDMVNMSSWKAPRFDLSAYRFKEVLRQYTEVFDEGNLEVLFFEVLEKDSEKYLEEWCEMLGVGNYNPKSLIEESNRKWSKERIGLAAMMENTCVCSVDKKRSKSSYKNISKSGLVIKALEKTLKSFTESYLPSREDIDLLRKKFPQYPDFRQKYTI
jgi:hypothetical protein